MRTWFRWESQKGNHLYEDLDLGGRILEKKNDGLGSGIIWLRIESSAGLLQTRQCNFGC
jgi:hypothetical protein